MAFRQSSKVPDGVRERRLRLQGLRDSNLLARKSGIGYDKTYHPESSRIQGLIRNQQALRTISGLESSTCISIDLCVEGMAKEDQPKTQIVKLA